MNYQRLRKTVQLTAMALLFLLASNNLYVYALEGALSSDEFRKDRPIETLKTNLENPVFIKAKQPDRVLYILGAKPGDVVADVGCGTGVFTFRLADEVGKEGKVYATEIRDELLAYVDTKIKKDNITNIVLVKSSESDPNLPTSCCDKILLFNAYHYIGNKVSFFSKLRESLKEKGTVAVISSYRNISESGLTNKQQEEMVLKEMGELGFRLKVKYDIYINRYFFIFTKL